MIDFTKLLRDYAIFLPAVSINFAEAVISDKSGRKRKLPFEPRDLDFLNQNSKLFYYPYALLSAGQAGLNSKNKYKPNQFSVERNNDVLTFADSGGYQIITGKLTVDGKLVKKITDPVRETILRWQEENFDWAFTLDVPPILTNKNKITEDQFFNRLNTTVENLAYIDKHRNGKTKFLNCLHAPTSEFGSWPHHFATKVTGYFAKNVGDKNWPPDGRVITDDESFSHEFIIHENATTDHYSDLWYEAAKQFPMEGWAFASGYKREHGYSGLDLYQIIRRLRVLIEDGLLENGQRLHVLGVGSLKAGCLLTTVQRNLRRMGYDVEVTYDASNPFTELGKRNEAYSAHRISNTNLTVKDVPIPTTFEYVGSDIPFPFQSPIGDLITMGDLAVKTTGETSWDSYSYYLLQNHNVYKHVEGIIAANRAFEFEEAGAKELLPEKMIELRKLIDEAFTVTDWKTFLDTHRTELMA